MPLLLRGRILQRKVPHGVVAQRDLPHVDDAVALRAGIARTRSSALFVGELPAVVDLELLPEIANDWPSADGR